MASENKSSRPGSIICRFKFKFKFVHVQEVCQITDCKITDCRSRHPKRCKFFFLRNFCKFNNGSPDETEGVTIREEIEKLAKKNEELKSENVELKRNENAYEEVKLVQEEKSRIYQEHNDLKEVNELFLFMRKLVICFQGTLRKKMMS